MPVLPVLQTEIFFFNGFLWAVFIPINVSGKASLFSSELLRIFFVFIEKQTLAAASSHDIKQIINVWSVTEDWHIDW